MTRAPWVSHFGFTRTPFSKTIPASQLCDRASHQEAVARIRFCIGESLLGVITGEVGVGKTVALRAATSQLDASAHHVIYVATPTFGARGLYLTIVHALGARPRAQKAELIAQARTLLAAEEHERRRRVVFIIDEAHLLAPDQLEELRLLTNAEMDSQSPFALLLVGQPTLARQLRLGVFAALDQRIATRYLLAPMDLAESATYLRHHLALVGRTDPLVADDAIARLHKASLGLPRALNNAAIAALIAAATAGKALVDDDCAKKAVAELTRDYPSCRPSGLVAQCDRSDHHDADQAARMLGYGISSSPSPSHIEIRQSSITQFRQSDRKYAAANIARCDGSLPTNVFLHRDGTAVPTAARRRRRCLESRTAGRARGRHHAHPR